MRDPRPEDYETVTNPERFASVVDGARALIDRLVDEYDARPEPGDTTADFRGRFQPPAGEVVRVVPATGGPLAFCFTDFPGVHLHLGEWRVESYPDCGCDACDDQPAELIEVMEQDVAAYVNGLMEERVTRRAYEFFVRDETNQHSWSLLLGDERSSYRPTGTTRWPAWRRRNT